MMKLRWTSIWQFSVTILAVMICGRFVWCYADNRAALDERRAAAATIRPATLLAGTVVRLAPSSGLVPIRRSERPFDSEGKSLLLVVSDLCGASRITTPMWAKYLSEYAGPPINVDIATVAGSQLSDELAASLARRNIPFTVFRVTDPVLLGVSAGITGTPTAVLMATDARAEMIAAGFEAQTLAMKAGMLSVLSK